MIIKYDSLDCDIQYIVLSKARVQLDLCFNTRLRSSFLGIKRHIYIYLYVCALVVDIFLTNWTIINFDIQ